MIECKETKERRKEGRNGLRCLSWLLCDAAADTAISPEIEFSVTSRAGESEVSGSHTLLVIIIMYAYKII
jgi:hypothetical protein